MIGGGCAGCDNPAFPLPSLSFDSSCDRSAAFSLFMTMYFVLQGSRLASIYQERHLNCFPLIILIGPYYYINLLLVEITGLLLVEVIIISTAKAWPTI